MIHMRVFAVVCVAICLGGACAGDAKPELISSAKIWSEGKHNAFTDLIRFHDKFYCVFRESDAHIGGDGRIRVLVSSDGDKWESASLVAETGVDLRDPKLSETPDGQLMMTLGGSIYNGTKLTGRQPRVAFSKDGQMWSAPHPVLTEGDWLWRVTWFNGAAYGVSYRTDRPDGLATLYSSRDGKDFQKVTDFQVSGQPNEVTLRFTKDGEMLALVRRESASKKAWIGRSKAPFTEWQWKETEHQVGGPNFIILDDGSMWAGGREYPGGAKTVLARMTPESYEPLLTLPSKGDNSYPGFVWYDNLMWMSYYSSHEGRTSIYLAKIRIK